MAAGALGPPLTMAAGALGPPLTLATGALTLATPHSPALLPGSRPAWPLGPSPALAAHTAGKAGESSGAGKMEAWATTWGREGAGSC